MIQKLRNSFAFRSEWLYKNLLKVLPKKRFNKSVNRNYTLITMCGSKHSQMLVECIYSIHKHWNEIPSIIVYSDGTLDIPKLEASFARFTDAVKILTIEPLLQSLNSDSIYEDLIVFSKKNVIGKKLAVIVKHAREHAVMWCDTDILWYRNLDLQKYYATIDNNFFIKTSIDYQAAYSKNIKLAEPSLDKAPFINTGVVLTKGDIFEVSKISTLIKLAARHPDHFSEQSILAYAVKETQNSTFSLAEIACLQSDTLTSLGPTFREKTWLARHYVGPVRHLFWRDAFFSNFLS